MYFIRYIIYDWIIVIGYSKHELGTINMLCPPNYKGMKKGKKWQPETKICLEKCHDCLKPKNDASYRASGIL